MAQRLRFVAIMLMLVGMLFVIASGLAFQTSGELPGGDAVLHLHRTLVALVAGLGGVNLLLGAGLYWVAGSAPTENGHHTRPARQRVAP